MSSRHRSSRRDPTKLTRDASSKVESRRRRDLRLEEQNNHYRHNYLPLIIPTSFYNVVHIHRFTTNDTISTLINHFESCYRYSIDTELDRFTYDLSLIQVHSIPQHLPSFIVLFEINQFPSSDSLLISKIKSLFNLLFRSGNTIFSWGPMSKELRPAVEMNLFQWPTSALFIDLQSCFGGWYRMALPLCESCGSIQPSNVPKSLHSRCTCTNNSPYVKPTDKWSLQNAICYAVRRFLDKSSTKKDWSIMLDPKYSSLSSSERRRRINYAIYDCFAVTLLHRAIYENWSLTALREVELTSLFTSKAPPHSSVSESIFLENISDDEIKAQSTSLSAPTPACHSSSKTLPSFLEDISDDESDANDEITVFALSSRPGPHVSPNADRSVEMRCVIVDVSDTVNPIPQNDHSSIHEPPRPHRLYRSAAARTRRNRKRNKVLRSYRDRHVLLRNVYHRFTLKQIKNILRDRDVRYVHLTFNKSSRLLSIGMKKATLVDLYSNRVPSDLFDKVHYRRYCRHKR